MSNRFHNKFHRQNHHSAATPGYPDSAMDPIASFEQPFKGEFYSQGDIITTENLSANKYVYADDGLFHKDLTVKGNFTVLGTTSQIDTLVYTTSAVNISNVGTGPALKVTQSGSQPIAHFIDSNGDDIIFADNGYVGLGVTSPSEKLTVAGNLSSSGTATIGTIATGATNSVITQFAGLLQKRDINPQIWDTTAIFVSASDGALTVNRLTKAENSNGINESIVFDNGTNVGIGTDTPGAKLTVNGTLSTAGTATIGTIATGATNSVLVQSAGLLQKRDVNPQIWDTTAKYISASDGALTVNRLTKAENSNGINESIVFDDGTNVGIGTDTPNEKLTVVGNISAVGTHVFAVNSTNNALRITQNGSGNALVVEDDTNPDSTPFVINQYGQIISGSLSAWQSSAGLQLNSNSASAPNANIILRRNSNDNSTSSYATYKARGTQDSPLDVQPDDFLSNINALGYLSGDFRNAGAVRCAVDGVPVPALSSVPGRLTFLTVTSGNNANSEKMRITHDGKVGIGTTSPSEQLTIAGNLSSSGTATIGTIATGTVNSVLVQSAGLLQKRDINPQIWDTTANFVSASDGALTVNRLTKATNSNGIDESIVFDNGTNVGIGTDTPGAKLTVSGTLSTAGTATIGTLATNSTGNSFVIETNGLLQKRILNIGALDTTAVFVSASDGALTVNRLTKAENSNGIDESIVYDDGTNVGIGTDTPGAKLTVSGTLSTSGTATIGTIGTNSTGNSFVVETAGLLQKRSLNIGALDTTAVFVSASDGALTVNRLTKATNSNGINESIIFDSGTGIGIDTDIPSAKLDVNGSAVIQTDLTVKGNFTVLGTTSQLDTLVYATSAINITNAGTGPALTVTQTGSNPIAHFIDSNGDDIIFADNGYVGLGVATPSEKLTIAGNLSSSGTATIGTLATNSTGNSFVIESNGLLQKRSLNTGALNTTATFVSASDGALSVNYLTKATNSNGINESIISDNGSLVYVGGNVTISGNLTALGNSYFANTLFTTTSSISVVNYGTGPAIYAFQSSGNQDIASFYDGDGVEVLHVGNCPPGELYGKVGINESDPNKELTVKGSVSASGTLNVGTVNTNAVSNSIVVLGTDNILEKRTIDSRAWGSSLVDGTGTTNYVTKWSDSNTVTNSIVFDNGTNVGIGTITPGAKLTVSGTLSTSSTVNVGGIGTGTDNSVVILDTNGFLRTDEINPQVWDTTSKFVSASDGALTVNRLTKAENSNGIDESIVFDNGTNVGIGTDTPSEKLTIAGNLSSSGTATIGTLATGAGSSFVIESNGLLQKRSLNTAAIDTTSKYISASDGALTVNRLTKAENSNGIDESIVYDDGTNVGIGTDAPGAKLTVSGTLSTSSTVNVAGIGAGVDNSVVILDASGFLRTDEIDSRVWGSSLVDGTGTTNYITKWSDADTITNSIVFDNGTNVGIGTTTPAEKLTIVGNLSSSGTATIGTIAAGATNSVLIQSSGLIQKRDINPQVWDTIAKYVSASDADLTVNRLTKATNSNGINESIVFDNGTNVGIGTDTPGAKLTISGTLSTSGTATIGTLATNSAGTSFVVETAGLLQKRSLNVGSLDTTAVFVSASDGALTVNRLTKATNSNGINESIVTDDGIIVSISGNLSSSGTATIGTLATGTVNSVLVESSGLLQKRTIDARAWGSSLVDGTGTTNYITKWSDADTITNSIVTDNGTLVSISGNLSSSGTATIGTLATGAGSSFVIESNGLLQKRGLNTAALDTTSKFVSASDGALTVNRLAKATNSNGINESIVYDDGANVGIGTDTPGAKLTVNGTLSTSSTVNVAGIGTGTDDSVVILDANGFLRTDEIDSRVWGSSLVDGTGTANRVAYWMDSNTISADSDFFFDGTNVGIGTTTPGTGVKLDVNGVIRSVANTVTPAATTALPSSNDVILNNQTGPITITAFSGGVAGVTYTITNKSTHAVTLDTSASLFVRGGNSWASHKCTTNAEGYIVLPQNFSCSLRMDSSTSGSAW